MGGCQTTLLTGPPGDVLGSLGIFRDEVRPEAPNHWARGWTRSSPALLQFGPGTGEVVAPGRGHLCWSGGGVSEQSRCPSCKGREN